MRTAIFALCLFLFVCGATSAILDTDGQPVRIGSSAYYLVPVSHEHNGGLGLATVGNDAHPRTVVLDSNLTNGLAVRFTGQSKSGLINPSMFLGLGFGFPGPQNSSWFVVSEFPIGWTVKISSVLVVGGPFKVHPVKTGYKIVYYPENGDTGADLGIIYSGGYHLLAVKNGDPFVFKIKKAGESSAGIMSIV